MQILLGWGLLALVVLGLGAVIRLAGPAGETKPHCGSEHGGGDSGGCCH